MVEYTPLSYILCCCQTSLPSKGTDHSSSSSSTSDIASCSYEARSCGVKNGMWLGQARQLCPGLICIPYEFKQYREVSQQLYEILASYTHKIQAVSCDEAFIDVTHYVETGEEAVESRCIMGILFSRSYVMVIGRW